MLIIENGTVYTPTQIIPDGVVRVDGRRIHSIARRGEMEIPADTERLDARGGSITPGLIDMHMHGMHGHDTMDGQVESLQAISALQPQIRSHLVCPHDGHGNDGSN